MESGVDFERNRLKLGKKNGVKMKILLLRKYVSAKLLAINQFFFQQ
jgi:hypothetical protein